MSTMLHKIMTGALAVSLLLTSNLVIDTNATDTETTDDKIIHRWEWTKTSEETIVPRFTEGEWRLEVPDKDGDGLSKEELKAVLPGSISIKNEEQIKLEEEITEGLEVEEVIPSEESETEESALPDDDSDVGVVDDLVVEENKEGENDAAEEQGTEVESILDMPLGMDVNVLGEGISGEEGTSVENSDEEVPEGGNMDNSEEGNSGNTPNDGGNTIDDVELDKTNSGGELSLRTTQQHRMMLWKL